MKVRNWMTQNPVTVAPETLAVETFRIFREYEIRHLPVVQEGRLVGVITDHDVGRLILDRLTNEKPGNLNTTVETVMTRKVITVDPEEPISKAALLMHNEKINGLPVVENGLLVGILTTADLLEILVAQLSTETR